MGLEEHAPFSRGIDDREAGLGKSTGESCPADGPEDLASQGDLQRIRGWLGGRLILEQQVEVGGRTGKGLPRLRESPIPSLAPLVVEGGDGASRGPCLERRLDPGKALGSEGRGPVPGGDFRMGPDFRAERFPSTPEDLRDAGGSGGADAQVGTGRWFGEGFAGWRAQQDGLTTLEPVKNREEIGQGSTEDGDGSRGVHRFHGLHRFLFGYPQMADSHHRGHREHRGGREGFLQRR